MYNKIIMASFLASIFGFGSVAQDISKVKEKSIYEFKMNSIDGKEIDFSAFKGKKILIVNVASKCGFTPQYKELEELSNKYKEKLIVIGFPSGDFNEQEFESSEEIASFCELNYGVTFQIMEKIHVKGENAHPLYIWLSNKNLNKVNDKAPSWNFCKYLLNEKGNIVEFYSSIVKPMSEKITKHL